MKAYGRTEMSKPKGRPKKYAEYDSLLKSLPPLMEKRPKYVNNIGLFKGERGVTCWLKIKMPYGGHYQGKSYKAGSYAEIKVGGLASWDWAQLEAKRDELQGKADRNERLEDLQAPLFKDWAIDWLSRAESRLKGKGYETSKIHIERHLIPAFGGTPLTDISTYQINIWVAKRLKEVKPSTTQRSITTLKAILNDAKKNGIIEKLPTDGITPIKGIKGRERHLIEEEQTALLEAAQKVDREIYAFIKWALLSGMRRQEILNVEWSHIQKLPDGRQLILIPDSKSGKSRTILYGNLLADLITELQKSCTDKKGKVFNFPLIRLRRRWAKICKQAGLQDVTIHDLRRTHSTLALAGGVDIKTLSNRMGHSSTRMLEKHYAQLVDGNVIESVKIIDDEFSHMKS